MKNKWKVILLGVTVTAIIIVLGILVSLQDKKEETTWVSDEERDAAFELLNQSLNFPATRYHEY